jgi:hypothetical protein
MVTRWEPGAIFSERESPTATLKNEAEDLTTFASNKISPMSEPVEPAGISTITSGKP